MRVTVMMFGALAEAATKDDTFDLSAPATAGDVVAAVRDRYPRAGSILEQCSVAVNQEIVRSGYRLSPRDEVALLPPSSGGGQALVAALSEAPSVERALDVVASERAGGTAVFVGTVRDHSEAGAVERLEYSAYEAMAENVMADIAQEAAEKWGLRAVCIEHAVGVRSPGEITFVVACAAAHRDEAFDACRYVVDEVKQRAPIWKKEVGPWGERWIGL